MSVDERLRSGLAANTSHLQPDVTSALGVLLGRAHRRRRARRTGFALTAAAAAVGGVLWVGAPSGTDRATLAPAAPAPGRSARTAGAVALESMSGALPPGTYTKKLSGSEARAVFDVPDGFTTDGIDLFVEDDGNGTGLRAILIGPVVEIHTDPCYGVGYEDPGPTVQDLAAALARQPLRGSTVGPVPASLGGHDGAYLEVAVPTDLDVTECLRGVVERWRVDDSDRRWQETPGELDRVWIVDVTGRRVVVDAVHTPGTSNTDIDKLTRVVESISFTTGGR